VDENPDHKQINWNEREDDFSSVAFWYQTGEPTFEITMPSAKERRLPNIERVIVYAKDFTSAKHHGQGVAAVQEQPKLHEQPQLRFEPKTTEDAWLEIPLEVKRKEPLRLIINATCGPDLGKYQAALNGVKISEPMDFYSAEPGNTEFPLLDFWSEPGTYTLRLTCVGKNKLSDGANLALESVLLRERRPRVEKYGHDKDKDWRKQPLFYKG
jgi:hypothetical protein